MLRASLGKVVHTAQSKELDLPYAAKVPPQELHKIAVRVRAVVTTKQQLEPHIIRRRNCCL
jgi:hypothetical protein